MEYSCKYVCEKSKSGKLESHRHDCNYLKLRAKRAKIFGLGLLRGAPKTLHAQERLERGTHNLHARWLEGAPE